MIQILISFLVLLQNPLSNQTRQVNLQKPLMTEKIKLSKLDPVDLQHLAFILRLEQFQRFKR
jgi:hypothetical protein